MGTEQGQALGPGLKQILKWGWHRGRGWDLERGETGAGAGMGPGQGLEGAFRAGTRDLGIPLGPRRELEPIWEAGRGGQPRPRTG